TRNYPGPTVFLLSFYVTIALYSLLETAYMVFPGNAEPQLGKRNAFKAGKAFLTTMSPGLNIKLIWKNHAKMVEWFLILYKKESCAI
ncbi:MAG: hypothetical protein JXM68_07650, partial [Sedimentisphaerales bacterium]|nr:hypothetical protein [Sedimentisphaerales bacterium]